MLSCTTGSNCTAWVTAWVWSCARGDITHVPKRCRRCTMLVFSGSDGFELSSWSHLHAHDACCHPALPRNHMAQARRERRNFGFWDQRISVTSSLRRTFTEPGCTILLNTFL